MNTFKLNAMNKDRFLWGSSLFITTLCIWVFGSIAYKISGAIHTPEQDWTNITAWAQGLGTFVFIGIICCLLAAIIIVPFVFIGASHPLFAVSTASMLNAGISWAGAFHTFQTEQYVSMFFALVFAVALTITSVILNRIALE